MISSGRSPCVFSLVLGDEAELGEHREVVGRAREEVVPRVASGCGARASEIVRARRATALDRFAEVRRPSNDDRRSITMRESLSCR